MEQHIAHSGAWGMAMIVIVVASWLLYRYLAPKTWKEWAGAGVVQAFIIALYAEIYGFPLTIYLLVRFFGIDKSHLNANLWSTLLGYGETGMMISMILGYVILFTGIGIFMEGWRELHRARQENRLITDRLYGVVRHPQYIGLFIALFGEGVVHWPTVFSIALFPVIVIAYAFLARSEERKMLEQFGEVYRTYQQRVPAFIPHWGQWRKVISIKNYSTERNMPMKESKILAKDPVCKMIVDEATALHAERDGKTFYFCCEGCRKKFMSTASGAEPENEAGSCCG